MLAVPSGLALTGRRAHRRWLLLTGLIYFVMIGFRFRVGMDWNNYIYIYDWKKTFPLSQLLVGREPGYGLLTWIAAWLGWGPIFLNAVSALVFCWGFFEVAKRGREPWIGVVIATPLLVIAFAMSGVRQSLAAGIIFHLIARWEDRRTFTRLLLVMIASAFHFSSIFMMIFVSLGSRAPAIVRIGGAVLIGLFIAAVSSLSPDAVEAYSRLYLSNAKLNAPGAIFQIAPLAAAGLIYLINRDGWIRANRDSPLIRQMAWASIIAIPAILVSSVGAYRFALYLWPVGMTIYSGVPGMIESGVGRLFYRICIVAAAFALLLGWLLLANNSAAWLPYQNWLLQPEGVTLRNPHPA